MHTKSSNKSRQTRVRAKLKGTLRPRLTVFRSNAHIWAQLIDDAHGQVIASASTKSLKPAGAKLAQASVVGQTIAIAAKEAKVTKIVFDRGAYKYHGRVKALAEAARKVGLEF